MHPNVERVLRDAPLIHGQGEVTHALTERALDRIAALAGPDTRSLETGSGFSTLVFAMSGATHTAIAPNAGEFERITAYCESTGVDTSRCTFIADVSERVLPTLEPGELNLVLIDGSHSFPQAFLDWFYLAEPLAVGGTLLIDDVHIWTGRVLRDFLAAEPEWDLADELLGRTAVFVKRAPYRTGKGWDEQPYVLRQSRLKTVARARMATSMLRHGERAELVDQAKRTLTGRG